MEDSVDELSAKAHKDGSESDRTTRSILLGLASAILFALGLLITESVGEVVIDVDLKPFFIPYLLIAVARSGIPTLSVGLGAAIGEGVLDIFEGYELDDPVGFIGYVAGFNVFGWYLHEIADNPSSKRSLTIGAVLGAFVQALFEGIAFLTFGATAGGFGATISVLGNTITHGLVLGALPLIVLLPRLRRRFA